MASFEFKIGEEYAVKLSRYAAKSDEIAKKAIYTGAGMVADEIRKNIEALPEDEFRHLNTGETYKGIPKEQKIDILHGLGGTPIDGDRDGNHNAKIGFDGYGSMKTKKYPKGVPNALIARATDCLLYTSHAAKSVCGSGPIEKERNDAERLRESGRRLR